MKSYSYKRKEWLKFREACLQKVSNSCERCERKDVILQIHHPVYVAGKEPWEYPMESCEVVCRRCHAEIHGKIKPSHGWTILYSDLDQNEPSEPIPCENCDRDITWHFTVYHPKWGEIVVGSECAENLSLGPQVSKLVSDNRRLRTFLFSPRWKPTPKGFRIKYEHHSILVFEKGSLYRLKIDEEWPQSVYQSLEEAKKAAFDHVINEISEESSDF